MKITKTQLRKMIKEELSKSHSKRRVKEGTVPLKNKSVKQWANDIHNNLTEFLWEGFPFEDSGLSDGDFEKLEGQVTDGMMNALIKALKKSL
jgi:hypothetical protein